MHGIRKVMPTIIMRVAASGIRTTTTVLLGYGTSSCLRNSQDQRARDCGEVCCPECFGTCGIGSRSHTDPGTLNTEHQKLFPPTSRGDDETSSIETPRMLLETQRDPHESC